jgi:hypothetical protein
MRVIYMAHPLAGDVNDPGVRLANLAKAKRWYLWIVRNFPDAAIIADWIISCEVLDDANPENRKQGMRMNTALLPLCAEIWLVGGFQSKGMTDERVKMEQLTRRIVDLLFLGSEPPETVTDEVRALCAA